jgi:peptidoglycan hydrolase-like protein with peptidoglycan-binding domain
MTTPPGGGRESLSSSQVCEMQRALKQAGHDPGRMDCVMGPKTQEALHAYQRERNLKTEAEALQQLGVASPAGRGRQSMRQR